MVALEKKLGGEVIRIHCRGDLNVCAKFNVNV